MLSGTFGTLHNTVGFSGHLELYTVALGVCIDAFMLFLW